MDTAIEEMSKSCQSCQSMGKSPPKVDPRPLTWPDRPFQRIHVDFAGPFKFLGKMFLIIVDVYSKWLEIYSMSSTTADKTVEVLRDVFSRFGLPEVLVSDNGPQFISQEFVTFLSSMGIEHVKSAPYHTQSNGEEERAVQTFKTALKAMADREGSLSQKLSTFLFHYRNTPQATTGISPSELFLSRRVRTRLSLLSPDVAAKVRKKQHQQSSKTSLERMFKPGIKSGHSHSVMARNGKEL